MCGDSFAINGKTVCVPHYFNKPLVLRSNYEHIMKDMSIMVFEEDIVCGNYSLFNESIDLSKTMVSIIFGYHFNKPFILTKHITQLKLGYEYNQPIRLSKNQQVMIFGRIFNQLIQLPKSITKLRFGNVFNQCIKLSKHIVHLKIGYYFDQSIELTKAIMYLDYDCRNTRSSIFPKNIIEFTHGYADGYHVILPPYIKKLTVDTDGHYIVDNLPNSVEEITLGVYFKIPFDNVPNSVVKIKMDARLYHYKHKRSIRHLLLE